MIDWCNRATPAGPWVRPCLGAPRLRCLHALHLRRPRRLLDGLQARRAALCTALCTALGTALCTAPKKLLLGLRAVLLLRLLSLLLLLVQPLRLLSLLLLPLPLLPGVAC